MINPLATDDVNMVPLDMLHPIKVGSRSGFQGVKEYQRCLYKTGQVYTQSQIFTLQS